MYAWWHTEHPLHIQLKSRHQHTSFDKHNLPATASSEAAHYAGVV
jgi:hypothetical protein